MKTIEISLYKFEELSEAAQKNAINNGRENVCVDFIYDDAYKTVKAFNNVFRTSEGRLSWLDVENSNFDDAILELKGFRLQKYIWNNYKNELVKGKYYSIWSKKEKSYKHYKDGYPVLKNRYSKILKENSCVLTGVCYDDDILQPIYDFLQKRDFSNCTINFESLLNNCFFELKKSIENEVDYRNSDEGIREELSEKDNYYTINGQIY